MILLILQTTYDLLSYVYDNVCLCMSMCYSPQFMYAYVFLCVYDFLKNHSEPIRCTYIYLHQFLLTYTPS